MASISTFLVDIFLFIAIPLLVWHVLRKAIPLTVLPIIMGLILAAIGWGAENRATPSLISTTIGFLGVLLLAFTAGLETRHSQDQMVAPSITQSTLSRTVISALNALLWPFMAGTLFAYFYFNQLSGWSLADQSPIHAALAIGLCLAVSALPVLIGIVRELPLVHRPFGRMAVKLAVQYLPVS